MIAGEIQTLLCLAFGSDGITYSGTLSGDVYKWQGASLVAAVQGAHAVCDKYINWSDVICPNSELHC